MRKSVTNRLYLSVSIIFLLCLLPGCQIQSYQKKQLSSTEEISGLENYHPSGELSNAFGEQVYYQVKSISWEQEIGTAEVIVITPDLNQIIMGAVQKSIDETSSEDYDLLLDNTLEEIRSILVSGDYPEMTQTVEMEAQKTGEGYILISNDEFESVISGNPEDIYIDIMMEAMFGESND